MLQNIYLLSLPGCMASSLSLPLEMLNAAFIRNKHNSTFNCQLLTTGEPLIRTAGGLILQSDCHYLEADMQRCDLLLLPALWRNPISQLGDSDLLSWLSQCCNSGLLICAVGTSSFLLAESGTLDHKAATTHWFYNRLFMRRYPQVDFKAEYLITQADSIYCAGSVNSVADLMVHLIAQYNNQAIATAVATQFSPEIRKPFEQTAYRSELSSPLQDELVVEAQILLQQQLHTGYGINRLAEALNISVRSLNRRFKQATGLSPKAYLTSLRMNEARELLHHTNLDVAEVAQRCGYEDSSYFCQQFKRYSQLTPLAYRRAVKGKLFRS